MMKLKELRKKTGEKQKLSATAAQHADDGYYRRGNDGSSTVHNMVLIHSPDGTNVYGRSEDGDFEGIVSVQSPQVSSKVVWWCSGKGVGLVINRWRVQLPAVHCWVSTWTGE